MQKKKLMAQDIEKLENTSIAALVAYVEGDVADSTGTSTQAQCCTATGGIGCVCCITVDAVAIRYAAADGGYVGFGGL